MKKCFITLALLALSTAVLAGVDGKYFPGVPNDEWQYRPAPLLNAADWSAPAGFAVASDEDGLYLKSLTPKYPAQQIVSKGTIPFPISGKLVKITTRMLSQSTYTGIKVRFFLQQYNQNGNQIGVYEIAKAQESDAEFQVWCETYIPRNPRAKYGRLVAEFSGNPVTIVVTELKLQGVDHRDPAPKLPNNTFLSKKHLSDAELDQALSQLPRRRAKLETCGDQVQFKINDQVTPFKMYKTPAYTYNAGSPDFRRNIPMMRKAGFNIFTIEVALGVPMNTRIANSVWLGENRYQVEVIRQALRRILRYDPQALIMLELNLTPPAGWGEQHPEEIAVAENGKKIVFAAVRPSQLSNTPPVNYRPTPNKPWTSEFWIPSYYSEKFTADAAHALQDIFTEVEKMPESKALIGVFLDRGVDGQWFDISSECTYLAGMADYSGVSLAQFKKYLRQRYNNDVQALRAAWGNPQADFDTVKIPTYQEFFQSKSEIRRTGRDRIADYIASRAFGMSKQFAACCQAIKKATCNRILAGGYRAEGAITSYPFFVQQCSKELYQVPEIDFFASCPGGRTPEDPVVPWALNGSLRLRGKLALTELDLRSPSYSNWGACGSEIWYKTHNAQEFGERSMRAQLFSLARGGSFYAYDMDGGWFDQAEIRNCWKQNNRITDLRQSRPLGRDRAALFYSEHEWEHLALNGYRALAHAMRLNPLQAFVRSGMDVDNYLLDDIFHPKFQAPQVLCIVSGAELTPDQAQKLRAKWGNNHRVIIWMWAPGIGHTTNIGKVVNFQLQAAPQANGKPIAAATDVQDPLLKNVKGLLFPSLSHVYCLGTTWQVMDPDAKILGFYWGTKIPALAVKRYAEHTEIYVGQIGSLSPQFVRNAGKLAGAHIWLDTNDPCALAGNLLVVSAASSGPKSIKLKPGMKCLRALTPHAITISEDTVKVDLDYGEVLVLEMR